MTATGSFASHLRTPPTPLAFLLSVPLVLGWIGLPAQYRIDLTDGYGVSV